MRTFNEPTFFSKAIDASGGAQLDYSDTLDLKHAALYSVHAIITRTAAVLGGSVVTQKSNDGTNWIDVTTKAIADSASQILDLDPTSLDTPYSYLRVKISTASGKATVVLAATTKGF